MKLLSFIAILLVLDFTYAKAALQDSATTSVFVGVGVPVNDTADFNYTNATLGTIKDGGAFWFSEGNKYQIYNGVPNMAQPVFLTESSSSDPSFSSTTEWTIELNYYEISTCVETGKTVFLKILPDGTFRAVQHNTSTGEYLIFDANDYCYKFKPMLTITPNPGGSGYTVALHLNLQ